VGGDEYFDVSEPLYVGTADYDAADPEDQGIYSLAGPWRLQVRQDYAGFLEEPIDLIGMPAMMGKVAVFRPGLTNNLEYFSSDIKEPNDPGIPQVDLTIALRFENFVKADDPRHVPPLPVYADNPMIDDIIVEYGGLSSQGSWLLDTGATISLISVDQGVQLGLVDPNGDPIIPPDFLVPIGGIGGSVNIPGYQVDRLIVPTQCGYNLVFTNARIGVHDVGICHGGTGQCTILDGVFGSNFLCATMDLATWEIRATAIDTVVLDTPNAELGLDFFDGYQPPPCCQYTGDLNGDCRVDWSDFSLFAGHWLDVDCTAPDFCGGADLDQSGQVDWQDFSIFASHWLEGT